MPRSCHAGHPRGSGRRPATGAVITPVYLTVDLHPAGDRRGQRLRILAAPATRRALRWRPAWPRWRAPSTASPSPRAPRLRRRCCRCCARATRSSPAMTCTAAPFASSSRSWRPMGVCLHATSTPRSPAAFAGTLTAETRLVWIETPTNPLLQLPTSPPSRGDCARAGVPLAVDNTFATPALQNPLALGADIVVHSTTKYLGGHSDVVGGAVLTVDRELHERMKFYQNAAGGVPGAVRCLADAARRQDARRAHAPARAERPRCSPHTWRMPPVGSRTSCYPGLPQPPAARARLRARCAASAAWSRSLLPGRARRRTPSSGACELFSFAESLGGVESLVCHPATMTHAAIPADERDARGITESTAASVRRHRGRRGPGRRPRAGGFPTRASGPQPRRMTPQLVRAR